MDRSKTTATVISNHFGHGAPWKAAAAALAAAILLAAHTPTAAAPFQIQDGRFVKDGQSVFLNIIGYQPYEPGQSLGDPIRLERIQEDLALWQPYSGGTDPLAIRLYPQPGSRVPQQFYSGVRQLGFGVIRDIYFDEEKGLDRNDARLKVDAVLSEVANAGAQDVVWAWEIGNEYRNWGAAVEPFLSEMAGYIKQRVPEICGPTATTTVTWASYPGHDPLRTDPFDTAILPGNLDYGAYNTYPYWPERLRDHSTGSRTGRPYEGYLSALKACDPNRPLVISEFGLSDSPPGSSPPEQQCLRPTYPAYRYGGLTPAQAAEAIEDCYWSARLSGKVSGATFFEWSDEWHKSGNPHQQDPMPEEYFGAWKFQPIGAGQYSLQPKPQEEVVRRLCSAKYDVNLIQQVAAQYDPVAGTWNVSAKLADDAAGLVRMRWETGRGFVIGESQIDADRSKIATATFRFGDQRPFLGPAELTAIAMCGNGRTDYDSVKISPVHVPPVSASEIDILTLGEGDVTWARAAGRVSNVNLDDHRLIVYVKTNMLYLQPYAEMSDIFVGPDGYWWTNVNNLFAGELYCWLVPSSFVPPDQAPPWWQPDQYIAFAKKEVANDADNDLLPDDWERTHFGDIVPFGRYDDPDEDWSYNLEELLAGTSPSVPDDTDRDQLHDAFEKHHFGTLDYSPVDDPDGDGLDNLREMQLGTNPTRATVPEPAVWQLLAGCALTLVLGFLLHSVGLTENPGCRQESGSNTEGGECRRDELLPDRARTERPRDPRQTKATRRRR